MKIAVSGKGGSGKTTISGTIARLLARRGYSVLAIDGDSNPNLGMILGISSESVNEIPVLPGDLLKDMVDKNGQRTSVLAAGLEEIAGRYGTVAADGVRMLAMKRIDHAGKG